MSLPTVGSGLPRVVPPGNLRAQRATLAYTDTTAKNLFTLPVGAQIVGFVVNVTTEFNGDTSNVLAIGDDTTTDRFVADYDCGTGAAGMALAASADEAALSAATAVKGVYVPGGGTPSAGAATITCLYIV
jgi:hypothetical protein